MMGRQASDQGWLFYSFSLEERIPTQNSHAACLRALHLSAPTVRLITAARTVMGEEDYIQITGHKSAECVNRAYGTYSLAKLKQEMEKASRRSDQEATRAFQFVRSPTFGFVRETLSSVQPLHHGPAGWIKQTKT